MDRYEAYRVLYGKVGFEKLCAAKILIVGAGGIGCEILKNMILMGFRYLEIIDLDTIDVSNLNRQFLFRQEHVGKPKALVACEAVKLFNPDCKVIPHHGNIKDEAFNINYFKKFDCVLNALDNIDARKHVNRLCLSAGVPLVDSGSTGYKGQVRPILKGVTECYECREKTTQKVYPICTIRSTPDKPVHCIVWAKEAFKLIFGQTQESMLFEDSAVERSTYMEFVPFPDISNKECEQNNNPASRASVDAVVERGLQLLRGLFCAEIEKRLSMDIFKTAKVRPVPTSTSILIRAAERATDILLSSGIGGKPLDPSQDRPIRPSRQAHWDKNVWNDEDCAVEALLCYAETALYRRDEIGKLAFDKDDTNAMVFVCAFANLRSRVFSIPAQSLYDAKGMAGNIIPAIATTNAIVAAVQVDQACRIVVEGSTVVSQLRNTSVWRIPTSRRREVLSCLRYVEQPLASCFVCQKNPLTLTIDTTVATLRDVVTKVLKERLGFNNPSVSVGASPIYEEGEGCDEDLAENLTLLLSKCPAGGIHDCTELTVEDFTQDMTVSITVRHASLQEIQSELQRRQALTAQPSDTNATAPPDDLFYIEGCSLDARESATTLEAAETYVGQKRGISAIESADGISPSKKCK